MQFMRQTAQNTRFFLGTSSPQGFVSLFGELYDPFDEWLAYIIKGAPGTGKAELIKNTATAMESRGYAVERVPCPYDPGVLDAAIFPEIKACIADGAPPHGLEPKFPGVTEIIVNLGDFWDRKKLLKNSSGIKKTINDSIALRSRSIRFLSAANSLRLDTQRNAAKYTDAEKIVRYAARLAHREFGAPRGKVGAEKKRFLSAVTPEGITVQYETLSALCGNFYVIEDTYDVAGRMLLAALRGYALASGHDIISCCCPMAPNEKLEHLLIPELGLCFFTKNNAHKLELIPARQIHARRFMDAAALAAHRHRIAFNRKACAELINEAIRLLGDAKNTCDLLESYYVPATDFEKVNQKTAGITDELIRRKKYIK